MAQKETAKKADEWLSPADLSAEINIPLATIYQWRHHKRTGPPGVRIGKHIRYRRSEVDKWLDSLTDASGAPKGAA